MFVFLGETGDTDYEELISGTHKTIIMKGVVSNGSEGILRGPGSYPREDVVPNESPLVACISETTEDKIANTLKELSKSGIMWTSVKLLGAIFFFKLKNHVTVCYS